MIPARPRILFVYDRVLSTFVRADLDWLGERYDLQPWRQPGRWVNLARLSRAVHWSDIIFCWFASWHAYFPLLLARHFRRPSIIVTGGYDVACLPEIGYGTQRGGIRRWIVSASLRRASKVLAFSNSAREEAIGNAGLKPERVETLYLGLDPSIRRLPPTKEPVVLTVGRVNRANLLRKGLLSFARASRLLPDTRFEVVGEWADGAVETLRAEGGSNLLLTGFVSDADLSAHFARAKVYVQASAHEGFGLSLAEAMLSECIPVTTRCGSLPEVAGETGVYAPLGDPGELADGIRRALLMPASAGMAARYRIEEQFPIEKRRAGLCSAIDVLVAPRLHIP